MFISFIFIDDGYKNHYGHQDLKCYAKKDLCVYVFQHLS